MSPRSVHGPARGVELIGLDQDPLPERAPAGGAAGAPPLLAPAEQGPAGAVGFVTEGCEATATWTAAEQRLLTALPEPGELLDGEVWCALEDSHPGPHWALGQVSGDDDYWWLRWDDTATRREFVHRPICGRRAAADEPGEPGVPCVLPHDHPGTHSYTRPA